MNNGKKVAAAVVMSAGLLCGGFCWTSVAKADGAGVVVGNGVRLRNGPSLSASILSHAYKGDKIVIKGKQGDWYNVVFEGVDGWMAAEYVKPDSISSRDQSRDNVGWVTAATGLNLRSSYSVSSQCITVIPSGAQVNIIDESSKSSWYQIEYRGLTGWVSSQYISKRQPSENLTSRDTSQSKVDEIVAFAKKQLGKPYKYGAEGPNAFDCSGLIYYIYSHFGYSVPRASSAQGFGSYAVTVSKNQLKPGDILVFKNGGGYHTGIYIGGNQFIHAPRPGRSVSITSLSDSWYKSHYIQAKRVVR